LPSTYTSIRKILIHLKAFRPISDGLQLLLI
jgi:hypothetical protein